MRACAPGPALHRTLEVRAGRVWLDGVDWVPARPGSVHLLAIGKAAGPMLDAAALRLGPVVGAALAAVPRGYPAARGRGRTVWGEHPVPGAGSLRAGRATAAFVASAPPGAPVLCLLSGGGSATVELPRAPLSIRDVAATTRALLRSGVPIGPANTVRRALSDLKGGGLARRAGTRPLATLAISDVVGDRPADIASGPTVADPTGASDARRVVRDYRLASELPEAVRRFLREASRRPPREASADPVPTGAVFRLVGSNAQAVAAAAGEARRLGYAVQVRSTPLVGEASVLGRRLGEALRRAARAAPRPEAWISGGESTVTLPERPGRGGRNQELALAAAIPLSGVPGAVLLALGSDGIDGPTDAAGGWADGATAARARARGIDLEAALRAHASYDALGRLGRRVTTGPTGTNVADLQVALCRGRTGSSRRPAGASTSRRRRS